MCIYMYTHVSTYIKICIEKIQKLLTRLILYLLLWNDVNLEKFRAWCRASTFHLHLNRLIRQRPLNLFRVVVIIKLSHFTNKMTLRTLEWRNLMPLFFIEIAKNKPRKIPSQENRVIWYLRNQLPIGLKLRKNLWRLAAIKTIAEKKARLGSNLNRNWTRALQMPIRASTNWAMRSRMKRERQKT